MTHDPANHPQHCAQHQVQLERIDHIRENLQNALKAAHRRIDELDSDMTKVMHIINGNGTEGMIMRVHSVEKSIVSLSQGLDKVQQTMTYVSRAAWSIIASIGLATLYWLMQEVVSRHG